jgi:hypothetical protein
MKKRQRMVMPAAILFILGLTAVPVPAQNTGLCVECHSQIAPGDSPTAIRVSRLTGAASVYQTRIHPCPALRSLAEESFFTESRIIRLDGILRGLAKGGWAVEPLARNLAQSAAAFSSLQTEPTQSSSQFSKEASALRARIQKVYDRTVQMREETDRRWLIGVGSLILLALLVLAGIGYGKWNRMGKILLVAGLAGTCLTLNACSSGTGEVPKKSPAQEQVDRSLSVSRQVAGEVDEAFHRGILFQRSAGG